MSAQSDKAAFIVTRVNRFGRATGARYFRKFERDEAAAYAAKLVEHGVDHKFVELKGA